MRNDDRRDVGCQFLSLRFIQYSKLILIDILVDIPSLKPDICPFIYKGMQLFNLSLTLFNNLPSPFLVRPIRIFPALQPFRDINLFPENLLRPTDNIRRLNSVRIFPEE